MSRWRRQQRRRSRLRREENARADSFGVWMTEFTAGFRRTAQEFGAVCIWAAGEFAKLGARREMREALDQQQNEDECL